MIFVKIIVFLLYIPAAAMIAGFFSAIERILRGKFSKRTKLPDLLQPYRDILALWKLSPISEGPIFFRCALLYTLFTAAAGGVLVCGGSIVLVPFFLGVGNLSYAAGVWLAGKEYRGELLRAACWVVLYSFVSLGIYLSIGSATGSGSFFVSDLFIAKCISAILLPGLVLVVFLFGIVGRRASYLDGTVREEYSGRNLAVLELGHWHEHVLLAVTLFLLHFSGTWQSGLIGAVVVLAFLSLRAVDGRFRRFLVTPWVEIAGFIGLAVCLLNFIWLL